MTRRDFLAAVSLAGIAALAPVPASASGALFGSRRISVQTQGSGPDVVLVPGLAATRDVWRGIVAALPGYRYHLVEVAGFGGSPAGANDRGPLLLPLADEIARYVREAGLRRPAVVGHSMGGTLALLVAARHPASVGRVMVVDMLPQAAALLGSSADNVRELADSLDAVAEAPGGRALVASMIGLFGGTDSAAGRSDPDVVAHAMHELAIGDFGAEIGRIKAPVTVVYASVDASTRAMRDRQYAAAYRGVPNVRLVRIDDSGHLIMADQPARFRAALAAFLEH